MNKIFLSEITRHRALIFGLKHHLLNSTKFVQFLPVGLAPGGGGGHMFNIGLYREKHDKIFLSEIIWPKASILSM